MISRGQNDGADFQFKPFRHLSMGIQRDGVSAARLNALKTLTAIPAIEAAIRFFLSNFFPKAQFDFLEVAVSPGQIEFRHTCPGFLGGIFGDGTIDRMFVGQGCSAFCHVFFVEAADNGFGRFTACRNGLNGDSGTGLQIAPGKNPFSPGFVGDRVHFNRAPPGKFQTRNVFQRGKVGPLTDGRDELIDIHIKIAARNGDGAPPARCIGFAQFHANAPQSDQSTAFNQCGLWRAKVGQGNAFGLRRLDFILPGRHLGPRTTVQNGHGFGPQSNGCARYVNGHIAAPHDGHVVAHRRGAFQVHFSQKINALTDTLRFFSGNVQTDPLVGAEGQINRFVVPI